MTQHEKLPLAQRKGNGSKRAGFQAGADDQIGDRGRSRPCLHSGADSLVGRQFKAQRQVGKFQPQIAQSILEDGSSTRAGLAQHPLRLCQIGRRNLGAFRPFVSCTHDKKKFIAFQRAAGQSRVVDLAFDEAQIGCAIAYGSRDLLACCRSEA